MKFQFQFQLILFISLIGFCAAIRWHELSERYDYAQYCREHHKTLDPSRKPLFEAELRRVMAHNARDASWKEGINRFSDMTPAEKRAMLGGHTALIHQDVLKNTLKKTTTSSSSSSSSSFSSSSQLPLSLDWRTIPGVLSAVKDQGKCGSCWAFATAETVESAHALRHALRLPVLSEQQILDCTPNPLACGGSGGCGGGTATLALDRIVALGGQASEWTYPYVSYYAAQPSGCQFSANATPAAAVVGGYEVLPANEPQPLLERLQGGPVIVNVDSSAWHSYEEGVFDGCNQTHPTINHVVQAVGYTPSSWIVRNSWSPEWGEAGFIRLARDPASQPCGTDLNPQAGIECLNGPSQVTVCGTCGITYNSVVPKVL